MFRSVRNSTEQPLAVGLGPHKREGGLCLRRACRAHEGFLKHPEDFSVTAGLVGEGVILLLRVLRECESESDHVRARPVGGEEVAALHVDDREMELGVGQETPSSVLERLRADER